MKIQRREFLAKSALGLGSALLGRSLLADTAPRTKFFDPYERVKLGKTPLATTRFCLGTGMKGGQRQSNQTRLGKEKFEALIHEAYDRGVRTFDLADLYGTHPYVIPALKGIPRDKFQIFSKIWWRDGGIPEKERPDADVVIERFLRELNTDYIDLVLLHCVVSPKWPEELRRQMDLLSKLKEKKTPRDQFQIVTKIWWREGGIPEKERPDADGCIERFLRALQTDYIDLVLLACVVSPTSPD